MTSLCSAVSRALLHLVFAIEHIFRSSIFCLDYDDLNSPFKVSTFLNISDEDSNTNEFLHA